MPVVFVSIDAAARATYLEIYKAEAIDAVDAHIEKILAVNFDRTTFVETVYQHRAVQAFAYLNDPDRDDNIARYPLIATGIPSYGATRLDVANAYIEFNNSISVALISLYEDHRHVVNEHIPAQVDKPQIDTLRDAFIASHPIWG